MSFKSTALIARKSIRARFGASSPSPSPSSSASRSSSGPSSSPTACATRSTTCSPRSARTSTSRSAHSWRSATTARTSSAIPIPASLADQVAQVEGVASTEPLLQRYAQLVDQDGEPVSTQGAPTLGVAWTGDQSLSGLEIKGEGRPPSGPDEVAIDKASADRENFEVGDTIEVITDTGTNPFTITALVGLGDSDGFAGATLAAWDVPTAQQVTGAIDELDGVDVAVEEGVDPATVAARIEEILPERTEVVTRETLIEESNAAVDTFISAFGNGLLAFAFVTAFVSAFLINNVFQITIGQRLRELALMRAVGATGRQVRRMIYTEAFVMAIIATMPRHRWRHPRRQGDHRHLQLGRCRLPRERHGAAAANGRRRRPRRCRHHAALGDHPGPPRRQDPARRGDAPRARLRSHEPEAPRGRRPGHGGRGGDVRARAVRPPGRHDRPARPRRRRGPPDLPRRRQRLLDRGPTGDQADRLAGGPSARRHRQAGQGERRPGAAADVGDGRRADDRRGPRQRRSRLRLVAAGHVLGDPRGLRPGRLHHHRRVVPGSAADRGPDAGHRAGGLGGDRRARGGGPHRRRARRRSARPTRRPSSNSSTSGSSTAASRGWRRAASWSTRIRRRTSTCRSATPST